VVRSIPRPLVRSNQTFFVLSVIAAVALRAPWLLSITLLVAIGGLAFGAKGNLIIRLTKPIISRYVNLKEAAQEDADQQRFNQSLAVGFLAATQVSFYVLHNAVWGWIFAGALFTAAFVALLGFCIGCWIHFQLHMLLARRAQAHKA